jgi:hypothetical protein
MGNCFSDLEGGKQAVGTGVPPTEAHSVRNLEQQQWRPQRRCRLLLQVSGNAPSVHSNRGIFVFEFILYRVPHTTPEAEKLGQSSS